MRLKKNLNASRPAEHPPVRGGNMSKRLGGIIGCEDKTSSVVAAARRGGTTAGTPGTQPLRPCLVTTQHNTPPHPAREELETETKPCGICSTVSFLLIGSLSDLSWDGPRAMGGRREKINRKVKTHTKPCHITTVCSNIKCRSPS